MNAFAQASFFMVVAMLLGAFATFLNVVMAQCELTSQQVTAYIVGGALGGMVAAWGIGFTPDIRPSLVVLVMLSGYLGADVLHALACGRKPR